MFSLSVWMVISSLYRKGKGAVFVGGGKKNTEFSFEEVEFKMSIGHLGAGADTQWKM